MNSTRDDPAKAGVWIDNDGFLSRQGGINL